MDSQVEFVEQSTLHQKFEVPHLRIIKKPYAVGSISNTLFLSLAYYYFFFKFQKAEKDGECLFLRVNISLIPKK